MKNIEKKEKKEMNGRVYLRVPYERKDMAKKNGCKFCGIYKLWYTYKDNEKYDYLTKKCFISVK